MGSLALVLSRIATPDLPRMGRRTPSRILHGPANIMTSKGKRRNTVIRSLAFKCIRILFRCWKDHTPYSEATYQRTLVTRQPERSENGKAVDLQWKRIAGFSKIVAVTA